MYTNQFYLSLDPLDYQFRVDNMSDNQVQNTRPAYLWDEYTLPATGGGWAKSDWLPIRRCNYGLTRIGEIPDSPEKRTGEAELRFFKAYFYQKKIETFGDVPWFDKDLQVDSEELLAPRDDRKVVFAKMLEDMNYAAANLPEESAAGRLTKYAALMFKAEACLYEGTFRKYHNLGDWEAILRESASAAEAVINSQKFEVYSTGNPDVDYFDLFIQYELQGNPEAIMIQRFIEGLEMHNDVRQLGEQSTGYSKDFVNSYPVSYTHLTLPTN